MHSPLFPFLKAELIAYVPFLSNQLHSLSMFNCSLALRKIICEIMGKLSKSKRKSQDLDALKNKHRHADTKYRSNVQYLYSKLKEMSRNEASKDCVLSDSLLFIKSLESKIIEKVGSQQLKIYQDEFINFLLHEEVLWKDKNIHRWWIKVEDALTSEDHFDENERTELLESDTSNDLKSTLKEENACCHTKIDTQKVTLQPFGESFLNRSNNPVPDVIENSSTYPENREFFPVISKVNEQILISCEEMLNNSRTFK
ncbi:uncharacterized protein TNIN_476781 [Trichonephila inaurata madagascariensis]|uniref:Uncharacterized protein n=1 Tax=Trichonephila inaurata madagascariensis TaxID=2747483 RepID=A0A8X6XUT1_9ARAC|nr:uncharacterized protein TNIN_476781 [Trichonephila inaurata madagascariensis]